MEVETIKNDVGMSWKRFDFIDLVNDITGGNRKFQSSEYQDYGAFPIIDQSEIFISGFTNENAIVKRKKEVVIFGDHTKALKFVDFDFCLGADGVKVLEPVEELDSKFLYYFLKTIILPDVGYSRHYKFLKETQIPLPPLTTQKRIAEILDAADALRRKDQELLKKYDELAQAIFIDMFGSNSNIVKLNEITTKITDGVHAKPNYQETGVPFLSVKNATNKFLDFSNSKFISQADHEAYTKRCKPEFEDILYTKVGATYGRAAIIDSKIEFSIYVSLALIKPDRNKVYPYYLNFVLNTNYIKKQADRRVKGAGVPDLHLVEIKDFDIPLPSYKEQLDFSNVISNLNKNIIATKNQILESDNLFQTLIQKAFKGELVA